VSPSGISFTGENGPSEVPFADFHAIRLHTTFSQSGDTPLGICRIDFRNGRWLEIYSGDAYGRADDEQRGHYRDFVRNLHRRIPDAQRAQIDFQGGLSETRYQILTVAISAGALLFAALPIGLFLFKPSWQSFLLLCTAGGLSYAGWRSWNRNQPRSYSPDPIPDDLLP